MIDQIREIALFSIAGQPLVLYFGILTFLSFAFTAFIGHASAKERQWIDFKWHPRMVVVSFAIALVHVTLALSIYI